MEGIISKQFESFSGAQFFKEEMREMGFHAWIDFENSKYVVIIWG